MLLSLRDMHRKFYEDRCKFSKDIKREGEEKLGTHTEQGDLTGLHFFKIRSVG
jgi:hypothetical protein